MAFFTLLLTLFGLFAIFIQGKEDPILGMITIFTFFWTIYELFFKPEKESEIREWIEIVIMGICFVWILAAAGLTQS